MKKSILLFAATLLFGSQSFAQQKIKWHNLMISIHSGANAAHAEIIVTKEDGTQEIKEAAKKGWLTKPTIGMEGAGFLKTKSVVAASEDSLFLVLKPYFDNGWKLVSSNVIMSAQGGKYGADDVLSRYFLCKEDD